MAKYIYEHKNWPSFTWNDSAINVLFGEVRNLQGKIKGQMSGLGFSSKELAVLSTLTSDVIKSSEIEGEKLNLNEVRSSIARKLGINTGGLVKSGRDVDGVVEMVLDATLHYNKSLSHKRLYSWHAALFPTGHSGLYKIEVGRYRSKEMQIVSGGIGKEKVHFVAIPAIRIKNEMNAFIEWINKNSSLDPVLQAAIAHFWFIIIHPFDDGNGRIARALSDLLLARAEKSSERFYSMSKQILLERKKYYETLQKVQHSNGDITEWMVWFLTCLKNALVETQNSIQIIFKKTGFWNKHETTILNERQRIMLNKLLDGIDGKLKSSKWAKMTKCSEDTALRDIKDLIEKGILQREAQGGRSTNYELVPF